ncbi:MAG: SURF1 family protein [Gammaproteobacteria bacterium]
MPFNFRIKNYTLAMLALCLFILLISLGSWQLSRASQKKILLQTFAARTAQAPLNIKDLDPKKDQRFYRLSVTGHFDNAHTILLDNKTFNRQVGYEVYTPFYPQHSNQPILVDRGFLPVANRRTQLPFIDDILGMVNITGLINKPPAYFALGKMLDAPTKRFPLRVEYININEVNQLVNQKFRPFVFNLASDSPYAYPLEWQIVIMSPEKHLGYAVQWFALALTLLVLFAVLNCSTQKHKRG